MLKSEYMDYLGEDNDDFSSESFNDEEFADYIKSMKRLSKGKIKEIYIAS